MKFKPALLLSVSLAAFSCKPSANPDPGSQGGPQPGPAPDDRVPVSSVSLSRTSISLDAGQTYTLEATVLPSNATDPSVSWETDNSSIASVSDGGVVTAIDEGIAKITAKAGEKYAVCKVTVILRPCPVESVTLDRTKIGILLGEPLTLKATVLPKNAIDKTPVWTSSSPSVATVSDGVVTLLSAGQTLITATAGGKSCTCELTVIDPGTTPVDRSGNAIYPEDDYGTFN